MPQVQGGVENIRYFDSDGGIEMEIYFDDNTIRISSGKSYPNTVVIDLDMFLELANKKPDGVRMHDWREIRTGDE